MRRLESARIEQALEGSVRRISKQTRPVSRSATRVDPDLPAASTLFVAVVHSLDGVRFVTAADSRRELVLRLAEYVRRWGDHVLHKEHARHLRSLLARREMEAAVELYFGLVGERWDDEWLVTTVVTMDGRREAAAVVGEVALTEALRGRASLRDAS